MSSVLKRFSRRRQAEDPQTAPVVNFTRRQLPMLQLQDTARNNAIATVGEFVGTFLFLFFSFAGTQVSNTPKPVDGAPPNTPNLLYSSLSFGFSLMVNVWAFYRVTGGLFNPAVCIILELPVVLIPRSERMESSTDWLLIGSEGL